MTPVALPELPPLPERQMAVEVYTSEQGYHHIQAGAKYFTPAQMRAFALAERAAERERCAAICENNEVLNGVHGGQRIRPNSTESGKHDGTAYAAAIRNQD